jgi:hypothetical protein
MKHLTVLTALFMLAACDPKAAPSIEQQTAALDAGNTMNCTAGDLALSGKGPEQVGIASFGISGGNLTAFGLSLNVETGGKVHVISTSLLTLPLHAGTFHVPPLDSIGMSYASYEIRTAERDLLRNYGGTTYSQHFSPLEIDPEAKLKVQVDKLDVAAADLPGFKRVHAVGSFRFNGAALPGPEPSDACMHDGIMRSMESLKAGKRLLPLFNAQVCGAEKKHIQCKFDVVGDFVTQQ